MKLNLGGGLTKNQGDEWKNVDIIKGADIAHDLNKAPYPFKDNSIERIFCSHTLEHLKEPELFFRECQRILQKGGILHIVVPHYKYVGAYSTFGHRGFFEPNAIDNVTVENGHIVKTPFKLINKTVNHSKKGFGTPKEIIWLVQK